MNLTPLPLDFSGLDIDALELGLGGIAVPRVVRTSFRLSCGRKISMVRWGDGEPEAILLHGGFETARSWDLFALAAQRPLLALDLPGCGFSDWIDAGTYWPPGIADDVSQVIAQFTSKPVPLVGHSFGGLVAMYVSGRHESAVRGLILVDVLPGSVLANATRVIRWIETKHEKMTFDALLAEWRARYRNRSERFLSRSIAHQYGGPTESLISLADMRPERWRPAQSFSDLAPSLECPSVPLLVVHARHSKVVSEIDLDWLRKTRPDAQIVEIDHSGHHVPLGAPVALWRTVEKFASALLQRE